MFPDREGYLVCGRVYQLFPGTPIVVPTVPNLCSKVTSIHLMFMLEFPSIRLYELTL